MAILNIKNLPDPLYHKLKARAKRQHRSIAQEVTHILAEALAEGESLSLLELEGSAGSCGRERMRPRTLPPSGSRGAERGGWHKSATRPC